MRHLVLRFWRFLPVSTRLYLTACGVAGGLLLGLAGATWWMLERAYASSVQLAYSEVDSASQRLGDRVQRLLDQVNQTASLVKHYQEQNGNVDLVALEKTGLLAPAGRVSVALADQTGLDPPAGNLQGVCQAGDGGAGNVYLFLAGADVDIVQYDFRQQADLNIAQILLCSFAGCQSRLQGTPFAAEQIRFPAGIKLGGKRIAGPPTTGSGLSAGTIVIDAGSGPQCRIAI